jgi:methionyl-tRNA formyltransferase
MIKVVFFGNEQLAQGLEKPATPIFDMLVANYSVVAVVLPHQPTVRSGRDKKLLIVERAEQNGISLIHADQEADLDAILRGLGAEIGVLASYGRIIKQSTIEVFPHGVVNIHPSLLPEYRGSTPIETAILHGDNETGVSLMALVKKMDAGPIFVQAKIALTRGESKQELYEKLANLGAKLLDENLPQIIAGKLSPTPQDETIATYTEQFNKCSGTLDPIIMSATECERKIRAYLGWPRTRLDFLGAETIITKAKVLENYAGDDWPDIIQCANNTFLQIVELVNPKSGKQMKTADYLRGIH